jgi:asparagine synthase (glutamine-hydrolysing)
VASEVVGVSGLVGVVTFEGSPVDPALTEAMAATAAHRALDGTMSWAGEGAAFVFQRRQVLAAGADERGLARADGGLVCVADARLDNREELMAALDLAGPETPSDAEVLLAAYARWGTACAARCIGDFAFVVWDARRRALFAARDPMAMRSLAYHVRPGRLVALATEVKQLLAHPEVPVRLHEQAVLGDLLGSFGRPAWSFYEGIANLPPGHLLMVDRDGYRTDRFWSPDPTFRIWMEDSSAYADQLRDRFADAVAARLRTRTAPGILLSGGVDSGSVAATAGWLRQAGATDAPPMHAFSWAFDDLPQCDERGVSRLIATHYGMEQTDIPADDAGPLAGYPEHGPDRDDPFLGAFQPLIEHSLAEARSARIGVLLGGDRGDLVIGDTGWSHLRLLLTRRWRDFLEELGEHHRATEDGWPRIVHRQLMAPIGRRVRRRSPRGWIAWARRRVAGSAQAQPPEWLRRLPTTDERIDDPVERPEGFGAARAMRYDMIFTQLHIRGMAWSERTYARYGLSFADPFSDRRLVDFALAVPQAAINRPGDQTKPLMRAAMRGVMPEEARRRVDKVVPAPLYDHALRHRAVRTVRELLTKPRVAEHGWVDGDAWSDHYEAWLARRVDLRPEWWWTLGVEIWLRDHW